MKTLETEFESTGVKYRQIRREGDAAIYEVVKGKTKHFDVVWIQRKEKDYEICGRKYPATEMYPSSSSWGKTAWSCVNEHRTEERWTELLQKIKESGERKAKKKVD